MPHWRQPPPQRVSRPRRAKRTEVDGIIFDSLGEARRYRELTLLAIAGEIRNLAPHPKLNLVINGRKIGRGYITLDFEYQEKRVIYGRDFWVTVYEDYKPVVTRESKVRIQIAEAIHDIDIRITTNARRL